MAPEKNAHITLSELAANIKDTLDAHLEISYWVMAEIAEFKVNSFSGHCYLELVEKDEQGANTKARMRSTIWSAAYRMLKPFFETSTGIELGPGLKVLVRGVVEYHENYGLSLNIRDIDPAYTVGELALKMQQTIDLLKKDGVLDMNRELRLPMLPKTVAVISSSNAAGLQDFMDQLENNPYGYQYHIKLFDAVMQGDAAPDAVMHALNRIFEEADVFDAVAILRGGGALMDLNCFNDYDLCFMAAQFPVPILTGIGHEKDETVLDLVAHTKLKTPTAVAGFLIDAFSMFDNELSELCDAICNGVSSQLRDQHNRLELAATQFKPQVQKSLEQHQHVLESATKDLSQNMRYHLGQQSTTLDNYALAIHKELPAFIGRRSAILDVQLEKLYEKSKQFLKDSQHTLSEMALKINYQSPENILTKGYSITRKDGNVITDAKQVKKGDMLETILAKGVVKSKVD